MEDICTNLNLTTLNFVFGVPGKPALVLSMFCCRISDFPLSKATKIVKGAYFLSNMR